MNKRIDMIDKVILVIIAVLVIASIVSCGLEYNTGNDIEAATSTEIDNAYSIYNGKIRVWTDPMTEVQYLITYDAGGSATSITPRMNYCGGIGDPKLYID